MTEQEKLHWKEIPEYEGFYWASEAGEIKSKWRVLKPSVNRSGYHIVILSKHGIQKTTRVHRAVAFAFIYNPKNLPHINHKDGNKLNNHVSNLEWCDMAYNQLHSYRVLGRKPNITQTGKTGALNGNSRKVRCIDTNQVFDSCREAGKAFNFHPSMVTMAARGVIKKAKGYRFEYLQLLDTVKPSTSQPEGGTVNMK